MSHDSKMRRYERFAVVAVVAVFALLASVVAATTPAWEAPDEPDHVQNAQTIARGHWYRMERGAGDEAHQAPLYYVGLAGWQRIWGASVRKPPARDSRAFFSPSRGIYSHRTARDSADHRFVLLLRLSSVLLGAATVLLTAFTVRRLSDDPWTPAVAAAVVVGVPRFVFLSGVVNNDNLANTLGGLLTLLLVVFVLRYTPLGEHERGRLWWTAAIGATLGLLVLTKASTIPLALAAVVAIVILRSSWRSLMTMLAVTAGSALVVCGWWLVQNQVRYGDPLAHRASIDYLGPIGGLGPRVFRTPPMLRLLFADVPATVYHSFWYNSGWGYFRWPTLAYIPFWLALVAALAGLFVVRRNAHRPIGRPLAVLSVIVVAALSSVWITSLYADTYDGRLAFIGLPALACLAALGLERWRAPVALRFVGPAIGVVGTVIAIRQDILIVPWR
jgi:4-amino-4-deoxy-L-arabinose transferase-like glycosyltransferase